MKKSIGRFWGLIMAAAVIMISCGAADAGGTAMAKGAVNGKGTGTPVIALTYVPAYGVDAPVTGVVFGEDKDAFDPKDYRISLFLQLEEGQVYWPKPYDIQPYTDLRSNGTFSALFVTGGDDVHAKILHIMLIPSDYTPSSFEETRKAALDYVRVTRSADGAVTIDPEREAPEAEDVSSEADAVFPVSEDKIAVDVGFYTDGSEPGSGLDDDLIRSQLRAVSAFSDTVRFYSAGGDSYRAYEIAHEMGLKVVGTAYLCGIEKEDRAEMDALIEHCNNGYAQAACVGNEVLEETRGAGFGLTAEEMIENIRYVRQNLKDSSIPVATSDLLGALLANPSVLDECDLIMPNIYPYWGGVQIDDAFEAFRRDVNRLQSLSGGKEILISETGWPTEGQTVGRAVPGEKQAAQYFEQIREWSLSTGINVLYFDAADEPWKARYGEGEAGAHWGIMTKELMIKDGYADTAFFGSIDQGF